MKSKPCEACGNCQQEIHIGKSSVGWKFLFKSHSHPLNLYSYNDVIAHLSDENKVIYTEYNKKLSVEDLLEIIKSKQNAKSQVNLSEYFYQDDQGYEFCTSEFS